MIPASSTPTRSAIEGVALDFDGVLVDSMGLQELAWRRAVQELGASQPLADQLSENLYAGNAGERMFIGLSIGAEEKGKLRALKDVLWSQERNAVSLMDGVTRWLPVLAARYPLAIATTADRDYVQEVLSRHGLIPYIRRVVTDRDVPKPKPAPDMLIEIGRSLDISSERLCMVGDTATDLLMSRAAGTIFVLLAAGPSLRALPTTCHIVHNWTELAAFLLDRAA
jgi:AHBA synthesis associated protein